jgi:hypothetical protein
MKLGDLLSRSQDSVLLAASPIQGYISHPDFFSSIFVRTFQQGVCSARGSLFSISLTTSSYAFLHIHVIL